MNSDHVVRVQVNKSPGTPLVNMRVAIPTDWRCNSDYQEQSADGGKLMRARPLSDCYIPRYASPIYLCQRLPDK